jgi:hypothetical protein
MHKKDPQRVAELRRLAEMFETEAQRVELHGSPNPAEHAPRRVEFVRGEVEGALPEPDLELEALLASPDKVAKLPPNQAISARPLGDGHGFYFEQKFIEGSRPEAQPSP